MAYRYTYKVSHEGLGKSRVISGTIESIVKEKVEAQKFEWERKYQQILAVRQEKQHVLRQRLGLLEEREKKKEEIEEKFQEAADRTAEAQEAIESMHNILRIGITQECEFDWEKIKRPEIFSRPKPSPPEYKKYPDEPKISGAAYQPALNLDRIGTSGPIFLRYPVMPIKSDLKYQPQISLIDKLIKGRLLEKGRQAEALYEFDLKQWQAARQSVDAENKIGAIEVFNQDHKSWEATVERIRKLNDQIYSENVIVVEKWNADAQSYQTEIEKHNLAIEERKIRYESFQAEGIEDYCESVLAQSSYANQFPQDFEIEYIPDTRILVVEYALPAPENLPRLKEVKYVKSKNAFTESFLSESDFGKLYDEVLYQICLRSLHELFGADKINALAAVSFNGWVNSVDKATGKEINTCVLSIQVKKEEFSPINLELVTPKTCFKALKGVGSSKLHGLTPIAPVLAISREDKRFIVPQDVVSHLNEGMNLAAMDWEDFEHLIRQLFEQEFKQAGGEVKVTQASRDGGVDAVAFDPDVIRGGKTVIQAKRYTNTVAVSAVRDLYGTVLNEGASKGILVTTSDYGPDSYEFAKGKPLVLLSGANLLNLLEKHGHKARIDLREAKVLLAAHS